MLRLRQTVSLLLLALTLGCATEGLRATPVPIPPPLQGMGQIVVYRDVGYYGPMDVLRVAFNQQPAGTLPRGDVFYRNVAPGSYTISFGPTRPDPNQFKTITLASGQVAYVKIAALPVRPCNWLGAGIGDCDINGYTTMLMDPGLAEQEMRGMQLIAG